MIKRYELKFGQMVDDFGYSYIDSDQGEWCKAEDVKALETQNAELRKRVGELERGIEKAKQISIDAPEINMENYDEEGISTLNDAMTELYFLLVKLSSPIDVEKGEEV